MSDRASVETNYGSSAEASTGVSVRRQIDVSRRRAELVSHARAVTSPLTKDNLAKNDSFLARHLRLYEAPGKAQSIMRCLEDFGLGDSVSPTNNAEVKLLKYTKRLLIQKYSNVDPWQRFLDSVNAPYNVLAVGEHWNDLVNVDPLASEVERLTAEEYDARKCRPLYQDAIHMLNSLDIKEAEYDSSVVAHVGGAIDDPYFLAEARRKYWSRSTHVEQFSPFKHSKGFVSSHTVEPDVQDAQEGSAPEKENPIQSSSCPTTSSKLTIRRDLTQNKRIRREKEERLGLKIARKPFSKPLRYRCPLFFAEEHGCTFLADCPRDIIRHLKSHKFFFCVICSQHYQSFGSYDQHIHDKVCVALACVNRRGGPQMHQHVAGCSFDFNSLSTAQKWYALHALLLDEAEQPHWNAVCVYIDYSTTSPTKLDVHNSCVIHLRDNTALDNDTRTQAPSVHGQQSVGPHHTGLELAMTPSQTIPPALMQMMRHFCDRISSLETQMRDLQRENEDLRNRSAVSELDAIEKDQQVASEMHVDGVTEESRPHSIVQDTREADLWPPMAQDKATIDDPWLNNIEEFLNSDG